MSLAAPAAPAPSPDRTGGPRDRPRRTSRSRLPRTLAGHGLLAAVTIALFATLAAADTPDALAADPDTAAVRAAEHFLGRYVAADGRVIRHDQGGDTVSEGQAYGLQIAVAIGDREQFELIWRWTQTHLQRPDRLLAWRWADGAVADAMPATDADLITASALALAADRWSVTSYLRDGRAIAAAVLEYETVATTEGRAVVAGPWATAARVINPSYYSPLDVSRMLWLTGDRAWTAVGRTGRAMVTALAGSTPPLPPDWATLGVGDRDATPTAAPDGSSPRYGWEAVRTVVTFAVDCDAAGPEVSRGAWPFFVDELAHGRIEAVYDLTGRPLVGYEHPVALVAAAAAADAAGAHAAAAGLLNRAGTIDRRHPSYYGAAWVALGRLMLDTDRLGGCRP